MGYGEGDASTMSSGLARRGCDTQPTPAIDDSQSILLLSEYRSDPRRLLSHHNFHHHVGALFIYSIFGVLRLKSLPTPYDPHIAYVHACHLVCSYSIV